MILKSLHNLTKLLHVFPFGNILSLTYSFQQYMVLHEDNFPLSLPSGFPHFGIKKIQGLFQGIFKDIFYILKGFNAENR